MLSWGRSTYGGLGRSSADAESDTAVPEPQPVDRLDGATAVGVAAGGPPMLPPLPHPHSLGETGRGGAAGWSATWNSAMWKALSKPVTILATEGGRWPSPSAILVTLGHSRASLRHPSPFEC